MCRVRRGGSSEVIVASSASARSIDGLRVTGVSQCGHTCQSGSSGALQETQASFSRVVQTGQTRK